MRDCEMGKALNVDWEPIKREYLKGEKSLRELAEVYGISEHALEGRCTRESWNDDRSAIIKQVTKEVSGRLSEKLENEMDSWVKGSLSDSLSIRSQFRKNISSSELVAPKELLTLAHSIKVADDMARRSLGLADTPQIVAISSDSPEFQAQILARLDAVKKLVASGQIDVETIDVESVVASGVDKD